MFYQDPTKRTDVQNMLRILEANQKKADTRDAARSAVMGTTPEQKLASKEVNRRTYADALADIASNASQLRDQYLRDYQNRKDNNFARRLGIMDKSIGIENPAASLYANTANQWSNAASDQFKSGLSMMGEGLDSWYGQGHSSTSDEPS